ncbi:MAG: hypothetical protein UV95_C0003G0114 [Candidatus Falkowbacteria bacterium GW2011_GWF2_43_32]|nr:MAG: hypothetical protein UV95_C0003G0114 [Candidatus Falkowbacteria bacterium GW2011_GWF2_43_32]
MFSSKYLVWLFFIIVFIVINLVAFPFITGDIMPDFKDSIMLSNQVEVPTYYKETENYFGSHKKIFRTYALPMQYLYNSVYLWDYMGPDPLSRYLPDKYLSTFLKTEENPIQKMLYSINNSDDFFNIFVKLAPILNIKNIVLENDIDWEFYKNIDSPVAVREKIDVRGDIFIKKVFGELDIYEIANEYFLPIFYSPQFIIITPQEVDKLPGIILRENYGVRSAFYLNQLHFNIFDKVPASYFFAYLFDDIDKSRKDNNLFLNKHQADQIFNLEKINHQNFSVSIQYIPETRKVVVNKFPIEKTFINNKEINAPSKTLLEISSQPGNFLRAGKSYYSIQDGYNKIIEFLNIKDGVEIERTIVTDQVKLPNNSFEEGLWQERPGDCTSDMEGKADFSLKFVEDASDGRYSLEIGSKNHFACVKKIFKINLKKDRFYKYSFDFRSIEGDRIFYYYNLIGNEESYSFNEFITTDNQEWNHYETIIKPVEDINEVILYFYAPSDGSREIINRYDDIELSEIKLVSEGIYKIDQDKLLDDPLEIKLKEGKNIIEYRGAMESGGVLPANLYNYYLKSDSQKIINVPVLEFKKINPTKYRVIVHNATENFPLIFSESFHNGWKSYLGDYEKKEIFLNESDYKILDGNEDDQAGIYELKDFIYRGYISTLGNFEEKNIKHVKWNGNKEIFDYNEAYKIDFVSKNFQDTIQNDNLPVGSFYETWFKKPINDDEDHLMVNGYANSWFIDPDEICANSEKCVKNSDGSYDFELIIEFWPQRLFYLGLFISGLALLGCVTYLTYGSIGRRRKKKEEDVFEESFNNPLN